MGFTRASGRSPAVPLGTEPLCFSCFLAYTSVGSTNLVLSGQWVPHTCILGQLWGSSPEAAGGTQYLWCWSSGWNLGIWPLAL